MPAATTAAGAHAAGAAAPTTLGGCALSAPQIAYPSDTPSDPTGPGAIAWLSSSGGCGQGRLTLELAPLRPGGTSAAVALGPAAGSVHGAAIAAVGASFGDVAVLAPAAAGAHQVLVGRADGRPRRTLLLPGGGPAAIARGYLGDVAAAAAAGGRIQLAILRHYTRGFVKTASFATGPAPVTALALALDYRSDLLVAWQEGSYVYARLLRESGALEATQRVGSSTAAPTLQPLLSDNGDAMLAWAAAAGASAGTGSGTGAQRGETAVRIAFTGKRTRFSAPRLLASFADPAGLARRPGALGLVRLATENVLLAWTVRAGGHYRVLAAAAPLAGVRAPLAVSPIDQDATLQALATGPDDEALLVWHASGEGMQACSVLIGGGDQPLPCAAQQVPGSGGASGLAAGVDPGSDESVLAWLGAGSRLLAVGGVGAVGGGAQP